MEETGLEVLFRDVLLIEKNENLLKPYFLEISIEYSGEKFRKVGAITLEIGNPDDISTYKTKFISNFDGYGEIEKD